MSTTTSPEVSCGQCSENYQRDLGIKGSFCSLECWYAHKGQNLREQINNDHRYCSSCFRLRKEIEKPPNWFLEDRPHTIKESIIGFEYYTENIQKEGGFAYCKCGNVGHFSEHEFLRDIEYNTVVKNLARLLVSYYNEGQIHDKPNARTLAKQLSKESTISQAIGASIYER